MTHANSTRFPLGWLGLAVLIFGCGTSEPEPARLRIAAASDLQRALPILVSAYRVRGGPQSDVTFGASGQLAEQIRQGAPFDVFLSADRRFVEDLAREGVITPGSVKPYARGSLVLVSKESLSPKIETLQDLARPEIKFIALANPETAPYGRAAKQALERSQLYDKIQPKLVPAGSVGQALQMVQSGNAEVGFVGLALAEVPGLKAVRVPAEVYDPIVQCLGLVTRSKQPTDASKFADFLLSTEGQAMLVDLGFSRVPK